MQIEEIIEIVEPIKNKLYRYAVSIVRDRFVAEDIVQEAIIKVWKNKAKFAEVGNQQA